MREIGLRIAELRERKRWIQADLATALEMQTSAIARFEQGKGNPTLETLVRFAIALEVPFAQLFMPAAPRAKRGPGRPRKRPPPPPL